MIKLNKKIYVYITINIYTVLSINSVTFSINFLYN